MDVRRLRSERKSGFKLKLQIISILIGCFILILLRSNSTLFRTTDLDPIGLTTYQKSRRGNVASKHDDPYFQRVDCKALLRQFRKYEIPQMNQKPDYSQSFVVRTQNEFDFYVATHSAKIDAVRSSLFTKGKYYETKLSQLIKDKFQSVDANQKSIMIDVGGNIGWFSLLAASVGAEVFTFEPNVVNNVRHCESQALNGWLDNMEEQKIQLFMNGVGEVHGGKKMLFPGSKKNPGSYNIVDLPRGSSTSTYNTMNTLNIVSLDALADDQGWLHSTNKPNIGFMKIDVEGFELQVLRGAKKLLKSNLVENIELEIRGSSNSAQNSSQEQVDEVLKILLESGYVLVMHGKWKGPHKEVSDEYETWEDLAEAFRSGKYNENCLFRPRQLQTLASK